MWSIQLCTASPCCLDSNPLFHSPPSPQVCSKWKKYNNQSQVMKKVLIFFFSRWEVNGLDLREIGGYTNGLDNLVRVGKWGGFTLKWSSITETRVIIYSLHYVDHSNVTESVRFVYLIYIFFILVDCFLIVFWNSLWSDSFQYKLWCLCFMVLLFIDCSINFP